VCGAAQGFKENWAAKKRIQGKLSSFAEAYDTVGTYLRVSDSLLGACRLSRRGRISGDRLLKSGGKKLNLASLSVTQERVPGEKCNNNLGKSQRRRSGRKHWVLRPAPPQAREDRLPSRWKGCWKRDIGKASTNATGKRFRGGGLSNL